MFRAAGAVRNVDGRSVAFEAPSQSELGGKVMTRLAGLGRFVGVSFVSTTVEFDSGRSREHRREAYSSEAVSSDSIMLASSGHLKSASASPASDRQ